MAHSTADLDQQDRLGRPPRDLPHSDPTEERLAKVLRFKMEHLDPTADWEKSWETLTERQRDFYRLCIRAILSEAGMRARFEMRIENG